MDRLAQILPRTLDLLILKAVSLGPVDKANWGTSLNTRRAKFYEPASAGRKRLPVEGAGSDRRAAALGTRPERA
ncbi:MAG TPA: hypothetical protein VEJ67_18285 [Candidatus Cybelea sp.]|nr:hypothetical protein [Candidatus Cybelea sp.]